jgi:hypothetical protein
MSLIIIICLSMVHVIITFYVSRLADTVGQFHLNCGVVDSRLSAQLGGSR